MGRLSVLLLALMATYASAVIHCPPPYQQILSQCFFSSPVIQLDWDNARKFCQELDGDLAQPRKFSGLVIYLRKLYAETTGFFIGGTDRAKEKHWTYLSGRPVPKQGWRPGEPNNVAGKEHCLTYNFYGYIYPPLNDYYCDRKLNFVCEYSRFSEPSRNERRR